MITTIEFKNISDYIANYIDDIDYSKNNLLNIHNILQQTDVVNSNKDALDNASKVSANLIGILKKEISLIRAVSVLNKFVSGNNINLYLFENNILVKRSFANISALAGYAIDEIHIEG